MRQALISDIHGNLEALQAVLADVATQNVDEILCLGDIVGYGPNPCECLDLVMKKTALTIMGNHDQRALKYLHHHQVLPEFTCRFSWEVGSLAFWDNRCALHNPVNDYHGYRRVMHRITLAGTRPV